MEIINRRCQRYLTALNAYNPAQSATAAQAILDDTQQVYSRNLSSVGMGFVGALWIH